MAISVAFLLCPVPERRTGRLTFIRSTCPCWSIAFLSQTGLKVATPWQRYIELRSRVFDRSMMSFEVVNLPHALSFQPYLTIDLDLFMLIHTCSSPSMLPEPRIACVSPPAAQPHAIFIRLPIDPKDLVA